MHAGILPKGTNSVANLRGKAVTLDLCRLHEDGLDVILATLVVQWQLQRFHGLEDDAHRLDGVGEDDFLEGLTLIPRVATLVDKLHLLENRRLAGFTSTYSDSQQASPSIDHRQSAARTKEQHLDLVALHHLVPLELVLNLLVSLLPLLLFCAHPTTHDGGWW